MYRFLKVEHNFIVLLRLVYCILHRMVSSITKFCAWPSKEENDAAI